MPVKLVVRLFTRVISRLPMTPTITRVGARSLTIPVFMVLLIIPPAKLPVIPQPILVLNRVTCILCTVLPMLVLSSPLWPCSPPNVLDSPLSSFLNVTGGYSFPRHGALRPN